MSGSKSESISTTVAKYFFFSFVDSYVDDHLTLDEIRSGTKSILPNLKEEQLNEMLKELERLKGNDKIFRLVTLSSSVTFSKVFGERLFDKYLSE